MKTTLDNFAAWLDGRMFLGIPLDTLLTLQLFFAVFFIGISQNVRMLIYFLTEIY